MAMDYENEGATEVGMDAEEDVSMPSSDFFVPKDALGDKECKPGDTITLRVTEVDEDGDVGVKMEGYSHKDGEKRKSMMDEMDEDVEIKAAFGKV